MVRNFGEKYISYKNTIRGEIIMPYKLFLPSLPLYAEFMYKHKALCKQISFGLVGVEAFVEGAG